MAAHAFDPRSAGARDYMALTDEIIIENRRLFLDHFYQDAERFMTDMRQKLKVHTISISGGKAGRRADIQQTRNRERL